MLFEVFPLMQIGLTVSLGWSVMLPSEVAVNMDIIDQCFCQYVTSLVPVFISHFRALTV